MRNNFDFNNKSHEFRLKDLKNGLYQIHSKRKGAFEGIPEIIFRQAQRMGVKHGELKRAVNELHRSGHDHADFDQYGQFLGTAYDAKKRAM